MTTKKTPTLSNKNDIELEEEREKLLVEIAAHDRELAGLNEKLAIEEEKSEPRAKTLDELEEMRRSVADGRERLKRRLLRIDEIRRPAAIRKAAHLRMENAQRECSDLSERVRARIERGRTILPVLRETVAALSTERSENLASAIGHAILTIADARHEAGLDDPGNERNLLRSLENESFEVASEIRRLAGDLARGVRHEFGKVTSKAEQARRLAAKEAARAEAQRKVEEEEQRREAEAIAARREAAAARRAERRQRRAA